MSVDYRLDGRAGQALCGVSLSIDAGDLVGILGESGSGKSTLARAIVRLLPANARLSGSIRFRDRELTQSAETDLQRVRGAQVAFISQDPAQCLNPVLSVGTQIEEVLRAHTHLSSAERKQRTLEALRDAGFTHPEAIRRRYPHQLSGGERQRAVIAQSIACRPALLIADEPTSKLDPSSKHELLELLARLHAEHGMAVLLISHEPAVMACIAKRMIVMYAGEIVESGPADLVFRRPLHPYTQALVRLAREQIGVGGHDSARRFQAIAGDGASERLPGRCWFEERCAERMATCRQRHPQTIHAEHRDVLCLKYE